MVELIWTEPALGDLDAIVDYIALDDPNAAAGLLQRVFRHVEQLTAHPASGSAPRELRGSSYRQIIEPPCRVFYRAEADRVIILHVIRGEMRLRKSKLTGRGRKPRSAE